jgi:hypothetical protein
VAAGTIITVLSNVPWGTVIDAAPKVVDKATKLWNSVTKKKVSEEPQKPVRVAADPFEELKFRVDALQATTDQLKEEMQAASALIKTLAEQNTALMQRVELNRKRLQRQTAVLAVVSIVLAGAVGVLLFR